MRDAGVKQKARSIPPALLFLEGTGIPATTAETIKKGTKNRGDFYSGGTGAEERLSYLLGAGGRALSRGGGETGGGGGTERRWCIPERHAPAARAKHRACRPRS